MLLKFVSERMLDNNKNVSNEDDVSFSKDYHKNCWNITRNETWELDVLSFLRSQWVEHASILSLCHGIFTHWSIFSIPLLLWKKGSAGPLTQWRQLVSCNLSWYSHGRFDLKIERSVKTPLQESSEVLYAPTHRLLVSFKECTRSVAWFLLKIWKRDITESRFYISSPIK